MATTATEVTTLARSPTLSSPERHPTRWYRNTWTQTVILGVASFCCPGIWGAMANLGAGGLQSVSTGNAATSILFALMFFTSLIGPALLGSIGPRWTLFVGTLGYSFYAAGLYCNSKFGNQWFVILGAALCGITAGIFWAAEGTCIVSYPEPARRGRTIATWFSINQFGSVIGGAINVALNVNGDAIGGVSVNTYAVFIAIQCAGPFAAFLLSDAGQVERYDGVKPGLPTNPDGFWREVLATVSLWKRPSNWLFALPFFMAEWGSGSTSYYLATYFTVRARALNTLVAALACQTVIFAFGSFMDNTRIRLRTRAYTGCFGIIGLLGAVWIWFFVNQYNFYHSEIPKVFDWNSPGFANAWIPVIGISIVRQILYNWLYWVLGYMAIGADKGRQVATLRSVESLSSCICYGVSAANLPIINIAAVNLGIYGLAVVPLYMLVKYIADREEQGLNVEPVKTRLDNLLVEDREDKKA